MTYTLRYIHDELMPLYCSIVNPRPNTHPQTTKVSISDMASLMPKGDSDEAAALLPKLMELQSKVEHMESEMGRMPPDVLDQIAAMQKAIDKLTADLTSVRSAFYGSFFPLFPSSHPPFSSLVSLLSPTLYLSLSFPSSLLLSLPSHLPFPSSPPFTHISLSLLPPSPPFPLIFLSPPPLPSLTSPSLSSLSPLPFPPSAHLSNGIERRGSQ